MPREDMACQAPTAPAVVKTRPVRVNERNRPAPLGLARFGQSGNQARGSVKSHTWSARRIPFFALRDRRTGPDGAHCAQFVGQTCLRRERNRI